MVRRIVCSSCEVEVLDMHDHAVAAKAKTYGVRAVPAVVVDGRVATCCAGSGPDEASLRAAGVGVALP
jgi:glutaredoxin 3